MRKQASRVVKNGQLIDEKDFYIEKDASEDYVYDVIRVIDGRPLFAEDHYKRLVRSLHGVGKDITFSLDEMCGLIQMLIDANGVRNDNVKIIIPGGHTGESAGGSAVDAGDAGGEAGKSDVYLMLMNAVYPAPADYEKGVDTELYRAVRTDPHVKKRNLALREATNEIIARDRVFEVILTDQDGDITEGSRSNIFFIRGDVVYTCSESGVLQGVTRKKIIDICRASGIEVKECIISAKSLGDYDAAFISGTSPKVLPIRRIGDVQMDVNNELLRRIMRLYDEEMERSCGK